MILPAGPPLVATIAGMLLGWYGPGWRDGFLLVLACCVPPALVLCMVIRRPLVQRSSLLLFLLFLAAVRTSRGLRPEFPPDHLVHQASGSPVLLQGVLYRQPTVQATLTRLPFEAHCTRSSGRVQWVQGRADLWVPDRMPDLWVGDILLVETRLRIPVNLGNPGEFNWRARSFLQGVPVRGSVRDAGHLFRLGVSEGYRFERFVQRVRSHLAAFLEREPDPEVRGLLRAWFIGDRSGLPEPVVEAFRSAGLAHLLAISGLHVGLVGLFAYRALKSMLRRSVWILLRVSVEKVSVLGSLPAVLAYVCLVGSPVTALRAGTMFVLFVGSLLLDRAHAVWNALAMAALLILLWDPAALFSPSFLLSFVAVAGLLAAVSMGEPLPSRAGKTGTRPRDLLWGRFRTSACRLFTASLAATIATAPLAAFFFNRVTPLAVLVNLVVVPVVGWLVIPLGFATALTALVSVHAALPLLWLTSTATRFVAGAATVCAGIPFASLWVCRPTVLEMAMLYVGFFGWHWLRGSRWRKRLVVTCLIIFCVSVAWSAVRSRWQRDFVITFLSVGQGDSILVEFPGGKRMIVDGGIARKGYHDAGRRVVSPFLAYRRIRRLDYIVASHGQADHYGGLSFLAEALGPDELWVSPEGGFEPEGYRQFLDLCRGEGIRVRSLCRGMVPVRINGVEVEVLSPACEVRRAGGGEAACAHRINDRSLVMRFTFGRVAVLLTGDIEEHTERHLLAGPGTLKAFLLKVPHHGSPGSSSPSFLEAVAPQAAVVSCGLGNRFGFPADEVLQRYRNQGTLLYRTDRDGAVRFRTDGRSARIETFGSSGRSTVSPTGLSPAGTGARR